LLLSGIYRIEKLSCYKPTKESLAYQETNLGCTGQYK
jgi:hypothetical protein